MYVALEKTKNDEAFFYNFFRASLSLSLELKILGKE